MRILKDKMTKNRGRNDREDRPGASPCCRYIIVHHTALCFIITQQISVISDYWSHDMNSEDCKMYTYYKQSLNLPMPQKIAGSLREMLSDHFKYYHYYVQIYKRRYSC